MQYRVGQCASCSATFKLPATFPADQAKCKSCGTGIVNIGPPEDAPQKAPAAPPAPEPSQEELVEHKPSGKKKGPSMMEKLRAQRAAEAAAAAAPKVPAKKLKPAESESAPETAKAKPKPARRKASPARKGAKSAEGEKADSKRSGKSSRTSRTSAKRAGGTRGRRGKNTEEDEPTKKCPMPMVLGVIGGLAVIFLVYTLFVKDDPAPSDPNVADASPTEEVDQGNPTDPTPEEDGAAEAGAVSETAGGGDEPAAEPAATDSPPATGEATADPVDEPTPTEPKPEKTYDPASVDLSALEVFEAQEGTTPAEWDEINQLTALAIDPDAGAAGSRAVKKLVADFGPKAFGAIINRMTTIDYSTVQGFRDGDVLQRALMDISNGKNAGWAYSTSPKDQLFNRKVVKLLHKVWARARTDEAYWLNYSKQDKAAEDKAKDDAEMSEDDLDDLDDLDF